MSNCSPKDENDITFPSNLPVNLEDTQKENQQEAFVNRRESSSSSSSLVMLREEMNDSNEK